MQRNASHRYVACVTLPDNQAVNISAGMCEAFCGYFQGLFTREPGLSTAQVDAYLAHLSNLEAAETPGCEGPITVGNLGSAEAGSRVKSPGFDGITDELYFRQSSVLVHLLALYSNWMKQGQERCGWDR